MKTMTQAIERAYGPMAFWRAVKHLKGNKHRMDWADWDRFFALAEEHVLLGTFNARGEWEALYPQLTLCLLKTWRSAKAARQNGLSPWQWSQAEDARILNEQIAEETKQARWKQEAEDRMRAANDKNVQKLGVRSRGDV